MVRRDEIEPVPPRGSERTPAAMTDYYVHHRYWQESQKLGENQELRVSVRAPSGEYVEFEMMGAISEASLLVAASGPANRLRYLFLPYVGLEFAFETVEKGTSTTRKTLGLTRPAPPPAPEDGP